MPLSSSRARSSSFSDSVTMASMRSGGANSAKEFLPIFLESKTRITLAAMDIMTFFVSAWVMSGVLAPFSTEKLLRAMNALSTVRTGKHVPAGKAAHHRAVELLAHHPAHEHHPYRLDVFQDERYRKVIRDDGDLLPLTEQARYLQGGGAGVQDDRVTVLHEAKRGLRNGPLLRKVLDLALVHILLEAGLCLDHGSAMGPDEKACSFEVPEVIADGRAGDAEHVAQLGHRGLAMLLDVLEDLQLPLFDEHCPFGHGVIGS